MSIVRGLERKSERKVGSILELNIKVRDSRKFGRSRDTICREILGFGGLF